MTGREGLTARCDLVESARGRAQSPYLRKQTEETGAWKQEWVEGAGEIRG